MFFFFPDFFFILFSAVWRMARWNRGLDFERDGAILESFCLFFLSFWFNFWFANFFLPNLSTEMFLFIFILNPLSDLMNFGFVVWNFSCEVLRFRIRV